jgi:hypothetical protein
VNGRDFLVHWIYFNGLDLKIKGVFLIVKTTNMDIKKYDKIVRYDSGCEFHCTEIILSHTKEEKK